MTSGQAGDWLREQRESIRSWSKRETARRLIQAGRDTGDVHMPSADDLVRNIQRWERGGGITERYILYYCKIFGIPPDRFGHDTAAGPPVPAAVPDSPLPASTTVAYRGTSGSGTGDATVEREVLMAAHDGSDHAEQYEQHGIGETTLEQLRADLIRLSRQHVTGEPFATFLDMRRVRDRVYRLLDRRMWPREESDLHFLLGCLNGLMGITAKNLGYPDAAEELIRAGLASAAVIDHRPLQARLRDNLAWSMYWRGRFEESSELAVSGLEYISQGSTAANLHLARARATARLGEVDTARRAVQDAHEAFNSYYTDELLEIGGEFVMSEATHHCYAGGALAEIADAEAATELELALHLYEQGPRGEEVYWFAGKPLAGIDLAVVRLRSGALDGATAALEPALSLPVQQRITVVTSRLAAVRDELAARIFRGSPQARDLGSRIEEFGRETIVGGLHSLPG
jgi:hypothetical protein